MTGFAKTERPSPAQRLFILGATLVALMATGTAHAETTTLDVGEKVKVLGNKCLLSFQKDALRTITLKCSGTSRKKGNSGTNTVVLDKKEKLTIKANKCFLVKTKVTDTRVDVKCIKNQPTATPTATATSTPTPTATPTATPTINANAAFGDNTLAAFSTDNPAGIETPVAVTGLTAGDVLVGLDRRPQNGYLYGLGFNSTANTVQLYAISSITGGATAVGSTGTFVDSMAQNVAIGNGSGTQFGFNFNPSADRIRVVTDNGQNFRINPNTGAFVDGDLGGGSGSVSGTNMDGPVNGGTTSLQGAAYTNSAANTSVTTLYTLDDSSDQLCIQTPPNAGTQASCLTLAPTVASVLGFDIAPGVNAASSNAAVTSGSGVAVVTLAGSSSELLSTVNLTTGALTTGPALGSGGITGIALQAPTGVPIVALNDTNQLVRFNSTSLGTTTTVALSSLTAGETVVGIDYRPTTGELFGLGINATANTGTLYRIDPQSGAATTIGSASAIAFVDSMANAVDFLPPTVGYGFDFNPTADRIRVVTGSGLNFRINPNTGAPVDGGADAGTNPDGAISGATTSVDGAAYTNSSGTPTVTTLYTIDAATDSLYIQNPPNNGTQTSGLAIAVGGSALDFTASSGFDIPGNVSTATSNTAVTSGSGFAILQSGGSSHLYSIDLTTGVATDLGTVSDGSGTFYGLAVGQNFVR